MAKQAKPLGWRIVFWVAVIVLVGSLASLGVIAYSYMKGQNVYDDLQSEAFGLDANDSLKDIKTLADFTIDWEALRAINPDIVGWLYIPDTVVSYPIVHRPGDSEYYLTHNFNNESAQFGAEFGAIMLSGDNSSDFSDRNNLIYGHNMANGSMFAQLAAFADTEVFNAHRTIYLFTPEMNYQLQTFAVVRVHETEGEIAQANFASEEEYLAFVEGILDRSIVSPDPAAPAAEEIGKTFAFSTCDGADNSYRYITFATVEDSVAVGAEEGNKSAGEESFDDAVDEGQIDAIGSAVNERTE